MSLGPKINFGDDVLVVGEDEAQSCNFKVKIAACRHAAGGKQELGFPQGKPLLPACSHNWAQTDPVPSYLLVHSAFPFCQLAGSTWGRYVSFFLFFPLMTNVQVFLLLLVPPYRRHVVKHTDAEISRRSNRTSTCFFFQGNPAEIRSCCTWRSPAGRTGGRSAASSSSGPGCRTSSCPGSASGWPRRACSPSPLRHRQHVFTVRAKRTDWLQRPDEPQQQQQQQKQQVGRDTSCCDLTTVCPELDL